MTPRGGALLLLALGMLACGLSLGGRIFYLFALFLALMWGYALLSLLLTKARLRVSCRVSPDRALRGDAASLRVEASRRGFLPVGMLTVTVTLGDTRADYALALPLQKTAALSLDLPVRHVGLLSAGVSRAVISDQLGLFRTPARVKAQPPLLVLPRAFEVAPLRFLAEDEGRNLQNRTTEDLSSPEDTRAYRQGDALKRIHWKLSARKRALIVRKFETPAPPDTLILLDCSVPPAQDQEAAAALRDTLCESALSVAARQAGEAPVRVPFYGAQAGEYLSDSSGNTDALAELLALQPFSASLDFANILALELRRMRRTGATVIITPRLTPGIVEGVRHIRRMGPSARVYYVTHTPEAPADRPFIAQLQQSLVEVCYVRPA